MKLTLGRWGFSIELPGFTAHVYLSDLFFRIAGIGECAWNSVGMFADRAPKRR